MRPILFDKSETTFTSKGLGTLTDAISCEVTEERNGKFELEMRYPMTGIHFQDVLQNNIILAKPSENQDPQPFRIYRVSEPLDGNVTIYAEHISYALRFIPVMPYTAQNVSDALTGIKTNSVTNNPFNFYTDKTTATVYTLGSPKSAKGVLGGEVGSILQKYQGEYKWDNFNVYLLNSRGSDNGVTLRYGKNITEFEETLDLSDTVTGILPYWKSGDDLIVGDVTKVTDHNMPFDMIETIDVTSDFSDLNTGEGEKPTKAQVTAAGATKLNNKSYVGVPNVNFEISFVDLAQTEEYKEIAPLEHVNLCDTVTIIFEKFGINTKAKVIKTVYNTLLERYNKIEIGDKSYSLTSQVAEQTEIISDSISRIEVLDDQILLKVSKGTVSSEISLESGQVTISGNRLVVNSTNFKLTADGDVTIKGSITSGSTITGTTITGGTIIGTSIQGGTITQTGTYGTTSLALGRIETGAIIVGSGITIESAGINLSGNAGITMGGQLSVGGLALFVGGINVGGVTLSLQSQSVMIGEGSYTTIRYLGY